MVYMPTLGEVILSQRSANASYRSRLGSLGKGNGPESLLKLQRAPEIDEVIMSCIDEIWNIYDDDQSGYLDKEECFNFIINSFKGAANKEAEEEKDDKSSDRSDNKLENMNHLREQFEYFFLKVDEDGSGTISKDEMLCFIRELIEI